MTRGAWSWLIACGISAAIGCSGIGRAVVDYRDGDDLHGWVCKPALTCSPIEIEPPVVPDPPAAIDLAGCSAPEPIDCANIAGAPPPSDCQASDSDQADAWSADGLSQLTCSARQLVHRDVNAAPLLQLDRVDYTSVNLRLESAGPATFELDQPSLQAVSFELHGPITLRIVAPQLLSDVRIAADGGEAVTIEIEDGPGSAQGLTIAAEGGSLVLRRTTVDHARFDVGSIELESSSLLNASLQGQRLDATDSAFEWLDSRVERSVLSACHVNQAEFSNCSAFSAVLGTFNRIHLADCAEDARLYGAEFNGGQLDPRLQLDTADLEQTIFGLGSASSIDAWNTTLSDVTFCADQPVSFGGIAQVFCPHCYAHDELPRPTLAVCTNDPADYELTRPEDCSGFEQLAKCDDPNPIRMRPSQ
jgi:hypothetical protein